MKRAFLIPNNLVSLALWIFFIILAGAVVLAFLKRLGS